MQLEHGDEIAVMKGRVGQAETIAVEVTEKHDLRSKRVAHLTPAEARELHAKLGEVLGAAD